MDSFYEGEHSLIFDYGTDNESHSWEDWALIPSSRPFVAIPSVKERSIDIPGSNGKIDLSRIPLGMPVFNNRSGSWSFTIAHDHTSVDWQEHLALLAAYFHGQKHTITLIDDKSYYYEGILYLDSYSTGQSCSTINIKYDVHPFKWMQWTTCSPWEWNPFDLIYGEITQDDFSRVPIVDGETKTIEWSQNEVGGVPVTPTFTVESPASNPFTLTLENSFNGIGEQEFSIPIGTSTNDQIMFACPSDQDTTTLKITGNGYISIDFRPGRL